MHKQHNVQHKRWDYFLSEKGNLGLSQCIQSNTCISSVYLNGKVWLHVGHRYGLGFPLSWALPGVFKTSEKDNFCYM